MGQRKRIAAEAIKEAKKTQYFAKLRNCPTSPRKMRLMADLVRGMEVQKALDVLKFSHKDASVALEKLLLSAISNWSQKNDNASPDNADLYISAIYVDSARMLKRIQPAPQGRAHRIRKRSNHVTLYLKDRLYAEPIDEEDYDEEELDNQEAETIDATEVTETETNNNETN